MALSEYRYGGIAVIENDVGKDHVDALLRGLDPNLFCELQVTPTEERVWCVVEDVGGDQVPVTVFEHRGPDGEPIPYPTESMVETFRRRAEENLTMDDRLRIADERNEQLRERNTANAHAAYEDIAADFRRLSTTLPCLPRRKTGAGAGARQQAANDLERRLGLR